MLVGVLGAIVRPTDDPHILQLDCLASDFYRDRAYPTSLCYNPFDEPRRVKLTIGTGVSDVYDAVRDEFVCRNATDTAMIEIPADSAMVLVIATTGDARLATAHARGSTASLCPIAAPEPEIL